MRVKNIELTDKQLEAGLGMETTKISKEQEQRTAMETIYKEQRKELLDIYQRLSPENKIIVFSYAQGLLDAQRTTLKTMVVALK